MTEVRDMKKGRKMRPLLVYSIAIKLLPPHQASKPSRRVADCVLSNVKDEGVYTDVNDRSPRHEERAQDAPLSSVWCG